MLALLGEKNVRLFPVQSEFLTTFSVDHEDFFQNYSRNASTIILDLTCVDFSLDFTKGAFLFEVFESLRCRQKILAPNEKARIVKQQKFPLFSRSDFYIQNISINDLSLFQKIAKSKKIIDVFLIEQAICELCKSVTNIDDKTWWLYIAEHKSGGIKITAGRGNGIAYSRLFWKVEESEKKIRETIKFLIREGLDKNVKIISFINDIFIDDLEILFPSMSQSDLEIALVDIILNPKSAERKIDPIFSKNNNFRRFLAAKNSIILSILCILILTCGIFYIIAITAQQI